MALLSSCTGLDFVAVKWTGLVLKHGVLVLSPRDLFLWDMVECGRSRRDGNLPDYWVGIKGYRFGLVYMEELKCMS